ncbi:hypothetical protein TELCIR_03900 [Teladorsagia circumcincta]|uniref:Protein kinase domain-containing protein n=1 Tax=Teladorsagia circumcincta TaxID=45464 RepID=A0A2G9UV13_TELCI|nr:hypothetical protein TELCIR_03900 [Teladorsagia circumcincta]
MEHPTLSPKKSINGTVNTEAIFTFSFQQEKQLRRLYAMSYIPAGFWSRLITRIIGDENVMRAVECMFATKVRNDTARLQQICNSQLKAEWIVWQTGIELMIKGHSVFLIKQFYAQAEVRDLDYTLLNFRTRDEQKRWRTFPLDQYALVEMLFPALSVAIIDKDRKMSISTEGREYGWLECPSHSGVHMRDVAPDTVFVDIESSLVIGTEQIRRGRLLGRGAFGFVFRATVKLQSGELCEIAQKMLEPVDPGPGARPSALAAYRVCVSPLSLIVELAPLGALNQLLASHRKSGARLGLSVLRDSAVQVAKALEYLHAAHIIYRDLKSENVLAWRFPSPFGALTDVLLKLGDYGISRTVMPSGGAKGFGGTEGFMAPEIVRFNGEEEYTQKVDCFSFGMFLYELITLKHPFEGQEHVKERLLEGARPVFLPHVSSCRVFLTFLLI